VNDRLARFAAAFGMVTEHPSPCIALSSFTGSAAAFATVTLAANGTGENRLPLVLAVTPGLPEADTLAANLHSLEKESGVRILEFPPSLEDDRTTTAARLKTVAAIDAYMTRPYPLAVVAPFAALRDPVPAAASVASATLRLSAAGDNKPFAEILEKLIAAGYERMPEVTAQGELSVRGGVLDVWPPDAQQPVRAEFFGDDLESLRTFDPGLQTSTGSIKQVEIPPVKIGDGTTQLTDILPHGSTIIWLEHNAYETPSSPLRFRQLFTGDPAPRGVPTARFQSVPLPGFAELGAEAARQPELLDATRARLAAYLDAAKKKGELVVEDESLDGGFEVPGLVVVTKSDRVFAHRRSYRNAPAAARGERFTETLDIEPGEYVVHIDYGIGRFLGSTEWPGSAARCSRSSTRTAPSCTCP